MSLKVQTMNPPFSVGPVMVTGFGASVLLWCAWYLTHLPWAGMSEQAALPLVLAVWVAALAAMTAWAGRGVMVGALGGIVSALVGLLILGSKLRPAQAGSGPAAHGVIPSAPAMVVGFLVAGAVLGAVGGAIAAAVRRPRAAPGREPSWLVRFAIVAACAVLPLLFAGGLVTSTDSGMAVPDWPNTFGSNMFLYPLGPRSGTGVFLEHAHRLFGTLGGLSTLVLMLWALGSGVRGWARTAVVIAFCLVLAQGVLGGMRVQIQTWLAGNDPAGAERVGRLLAIAHGVLAQLTFGMVVATACYLAPSFAARPASRGLDAGHVRRLRGFATGLVHALILQLLLGALTRHLRGTNHAAFTHAGFSLIVLVMALAAGFLARSLPATLGGGVSALRRVGLALVILAPLQFAIGWATFFVRSKTIAADSPHEALIRTVHQAGGGLLLGVAACGFVWARWLWRGVRADGAAANSPAPAQAAARPA